MKVFIHIPKTAGTSICKLLSQSVYFNSFKRINPKRNVHPKDFLNTVETKINYNLSQNKYNCIGGHFGFFAHPKFSRQEDHFVMMRDPVKRVISEYYYMFQKDFFYKDLIESESLNLSDYLYHHDTIYLNNLQTRLISGVSFEMGDELTEEIFQKAVYNLERFAAIGITERFEESVANYFIRLNWKRVPLLTFENQNDSRPEIQEISQSDLEQVKKREKYDIALYKLALNLFSEQIDAEPKKLEKVMKKMTNPSLLYKEKLKVLRFSSKVRDKLID